MAGGGLRSALRRLCRAAGLADAGVPDADLLARFVVGRDQAAFELLLWRHGPMVLGVCERVLGHSADAEDAFQATFLALVRKGGAIGRGEALGHWLYRVAYRAALKARARAARAPARGPREREGEGPEQGVVWRDLRPVLDEEVGRLPAKYRGPVVLCDLGEQTYAEAARQLGCPVGTLAVRLRRARQLLRERLTRRGVGLSLGVGGSLWCGMEVSARVPAALAGSTLRLASGAAGGSARAAALAEGVVKAMGAGKVRGAALAAVAALAVLGAGGVYCLEKSGAPEAKPAPGAKSAPVKVYSEVAGEVQVVGREPRTGEKVGPGRRVRVNVGREVREYVRLREGDRVEEGELLLRLEDRSARSEVEEKRAKLEAAEADLRATTKTKEEAERRYEAMKREGPEAEFEGSRRTCERYAAEEKARAARVVQARAELKKARAVLALHEVRSPVSGVIEGLRKRPGDGVGRLEVVALIRPGGEGRRVPADGAVARSVDVRVTKGGKLLAVGEEARGEVVAKGRRVEVEWPVPAVEVGRGERVAEGDRVVVPGEKRAFRRWREKDGLVPGKVVLARQKRTLRTLEAGDRVEKGQLVALVNPALAADDVAIKLAQLDAAGADLLASTKAKEEAQKRYESMQRQRRVAPRSVSDEEFRGARLAWDRYAAEEVARGAALKKAKRELSAALLALKMHEVRSPVGGVVAQVLKERGDAARPDEAVLRVRLKEGR
jgi:RNA polymerase sigma factor (sigma-70 family)